MFNCQTFYQVHEHGITDYIDYIIKLSLYKEEHDELPAIASSADTKIKVNGVEVKIGNFFSSFFVRNVQTNLTGYSLIKYLKKKQFYNLQNIISCHRQLFCIFELRHFLCFQKMAPQPQNLFLLTFRQIWNRYVQSVSHPSTDTKRLTTLKNAKRRQLKTTVTNHDSSWT